MESVWDYPRPPRLEPVSKRLVVVLDGVVVADTTRGHRVLETSHPPVYYFPRRDVIDAAVVRSRDRGSLCEWKGAAIYFDVIGGHGSLVPRGAWAYPRPLPGYEAIRDAVAFYPGAMDACTVAGEPVIAQPGGFYGGWITKDVAGPFKGGPGTAGW